MDKKIIKLGIDIHGVINALPDFFSALTTAIIAAGGEIHILTGGTWTEELEQYLKDNNIAHTHTFSVYNHLIETGVKTTGEIIFPDGSIQKKFEDGHWDKAKAEYCRTNAIDLHIDDTLIYNEYFTTPFARLWTHNNNPKASHKDLRHLD